MKIFTLIILFTAMPWLALGQFQMECKITTPAMNTSYRMLISEKASKTTMNIERMEMILLNLLGTGVYNLLPDQNMAIKMNQNTLDTLEVCACTFVKTGKKKQILGYDTDEYLQQCKSMRGTSENHIWIAPTLIINPELITPMRGYIATSNSRPKGFPLLMEGVLSDKSTVKFEVTGINPMKILPDEFKVPSNYLVIEN